jgi:dTDP-4-dehydrorhamnose reductase
MSLKPLLIFGKSGQVAQELAARAGQAGFSARMVGRDEADFTNPDSVAQLAETADAQAVINAVAYTAVDQAESDEDTARRVNAETPGRLAETCARRDLPLIQISTDYVFDGTKSGAYLETDETGPASAYGRTKLAGEDAVASAGGTHLIVRTAWVYSAHGKNFVKTMLRLGAERDELNVVADQTGCPTHAGDLAEGLLTATRSVLEGRGENGIYNLAGQGSTSWAGFADAIFDLAAPVWGRRPQVHPIPSSAYPVPAPRPKNSVLDCSRFANTFGFSCPSWEASLARVLDELAVTKRA